MQEISPYRYVSQGEKIDFTKTDHEQEFLANSVYQSKSEIS
ncbi:hypothetical protein [Arsenophonus endosymbiont of Aleurodicus floccissimus]|nr:hypothetical protein [Arsenophonus endosymbiont of Aleurodicus floccissimus]